jgi:hypothetical protein
MLMTNDSDTLRLAVPQTTAPPRELDLGKQYQTAVSNRCAASVSLNEREDINRIKENIKENIKASAKESLGLYEMKHQPWLTEECSSFLDQRSGIKCSGHRIQTKSNTDNVNLVKRENSKHFRNKKKEYLNAKFDELETNSKIRNIRDFYRDINEFKKGYQHRTHMVKDEKGNLVTESHTLLANWRNHFSQLLNILGVSDVRQTELHTATGA